MFALRPLFVVLTCDGVTKRQWRTIGPDGRPVGRPGGASHRGQVGIYGTAEAGVQFVGGGLGHRWKPMVKTVPHTVPSPRNRVSDSSPGSAGPEARRKSMGPGR